jgi:hypothetical protein
LNARDAAMRGATILTRTRVVSAARDGDLWRITTEGPEGTITHTARALVNAGGPWVEDIIRNVTRINSSEAVRLVRGSHIVTRKLYDHDRCYFFQGTDGRIIFAIPYEQDFTLIGTTDKDHQGAPGAAVCTDEERDYLLAFASQYFAKPVTRQDVVWTYSGVRPLYNDGARSATAATRDYVLSLDQTGPLLSQGQSRLDRPRAPAGWRFLPYRRGRADAGSAGALFVPDARLGRPSDPRLWDRCRHPSGIGQSGCRSGRGFRRHPDRGRGALAHGARIRHAGCGHRLAPHQTGPAVKRV